MKFKILWMVGLVLATTVGQVQGQVQVDFIPAGLNPGDTYRLVFVTSTTTTATSPLISTYDSIVNAAVDTSSIVSQNSTTWTALVSTPTALGNVHSSVGSYGTSTRLYNTHGQYLGLDTELFFSSPVLFDENGGLTTPAAGRIWTGAIHYAAGDNTAFTMGGADSRSLYAINEAGAQSIAIGFGGKGTSYPIYGISGVQIVAAPNTPPTSNAGPDQSIRAGDTVYLNGGGSSDDNTLPASLDYSWFFSGKPSGSNATLFSADISTPSFVADMAGTYLVNLVVIDGAGLPSLVDQVEISSNNLAPTAVARVDFGLAIVGTSSNFDGSASSDPEFDVLSYSWEITAAPAGSSASLVDADTAFPLLTTDVEGTYEVTLTVSDFLGAGTPAMVEFVATTPQNFAEIKIIDASDLVGTLLSGQVTTKGNQTALGSFLKNATKNIQKGNIAKAIDDLNKARERTDGVVLRGVPDGNGNGMDWITDSSAQVEAYNLLTAAIDALSN